MNLSANTQITTPVTPEMLRPASDIKAIQRKSRNWWLFTVCLLGCMWTWLPSVVCSEDRKTPQPSTPADETINIRGIVVDTIGQPVASARVVLPQWKDEKQETVTNESGKFEFSATRKQVLGQLLRVYGSGDLQSALELSGKESELGKSELKLELAPARKVVLHVVDQNKQPVAGAIAGVMGDRVQLGSQKTDSQGAATFMLPGSIRVGTVYAIKGNAGVDYRAYAIPSEHRGDRNAKAPELPEGSVTLTLDGARPVQVRVVESDGTPLPGQKVYPWMVMKPGQPVPLNLTGIPDLFPDMSDAAGDIVFDWLPKWQDRPIQFWSESLDHVRRPAMYDPQQEDGAWTMTLDRLVPIRGQVKRPDGSPAVGMQVLASGQGYLSDDFRTETTTDANGRYELRVAPDMTYLVIAHGDKLATEPRTGFAVWPNTPVEDLDLELRPATRLFGRVTVGPEKAPVKQFRIQSYQFGADAFQLPGRLLPNPTGSRKYVRPAIVHFAQTDDSGNYELFVGPGQFDLRGPKQTEIQTFEVQEKTDQEFNFHSQRAETGPLKGLVETSDNMPVANATVTGIYRHPSTASQLKAVTTADGEFHVERQLHRTVLHSVSADGKLAGVVEIEPDDAVAVIVIGPLASAQGRLIDRATNLPLANEEIVYGVRIYESDDNGIYQTQFGGRTKTDGNGRFELQSLIIGQTYHLDRTVRTGPGVDDVHWKSITEVTPKEAKTIQLGDLKLQQ